VKLTVVKCGGAALTRGPFVLERYIGPGEAACVVHGAGARITAALEAAGIESRFVAGRRVTTAEALPLVRDAYRLENEGLCAQIGARASGLMGDELGLEADVVPGLGHVGLPRPVAPQSLWGHFDAGRVPVIAPLARGPLNVNADDAAAALSIGLCADRLVFVSDVDGVFVDGEVVDELSAGEIEQLDGLLRGGIVPKLQAAVAAAREGVRAEVGRTLVVA
jgi:acetylglutamate kinase